FDRIFIRLTGVSACLSAVGLCCLKDQQLALSELAGNVAGRKKARTANGWPSGDETANDAAGHRSVGGLVLWRALVQGGQELPGAGRRRNDTLQHDVLGGEVLAIQMHVGVVVRAERGAFEGDAGEQTTGA